MKRLVNCAAVTILSIIAAAAAGCCEQCGKEPADGKKSTPNKTPPKSETTKVSITKEPFGKADGQDVDLYTLTNANGLRVKIMTYGATIIDVETPDRDGRLANVTLSMKSLDDYLKGHPFLGSTVGRYANRIAKGKFKLDGKEYTLATNNNANHLHGGKKGFDKYVWKAEEVKTPDSVGIRFTHVSPDGDESYPGTLTATVTYSLTNGNELKMDYTASTDKPTICNLTNHTYWNLSGGASRDVLGQQLMLNADRYLPVDDGLIPTGEQKLVKDTPMSFLEPQTIGSRIAQVKGGYDHNYILNKKPGEKGLTLAAKIVDPQSGRAMEIYTDQPGIQFYSGNFLSGKADSGGFTQHYGFCLETQHYPDSPNRPEFPTTTLKPGEKYEHSTVHKFSVK
jgi:aldose 1-epimerase